MKPSKEFLSKIEQTLAAYNAAGAASARPERAPGGARGGGARAHLELLNLRKDLLLLRGRLRLLGRPGHHGHLDRLELRLRAGVGTRSVESSVEPPPARRARGPAVARGGGARARRACHAAHLQAVDVVPDGSLPPPLPPRVGRRARNRQQGEHRGAG